MLTAEQFPDYFRAVHGNDPFHWQRCLARQVVETGRWPAVLDLPTGVGKTAALDVALFALAVAADRASAGGGSGPPQAPRRIVFVVDRRVIVDQAAEHAGRIVQALAHGTATNGAATNGAREASALEAVRQALGTLTAAEDPGSVPLRVAVLRGGIPRDDGWAARPDQPTVLLSTVDQVGSRLLFRGYGVSDRMRPIHAGLLGSDTLFLLDEVHLSQPFADTLAAIARYREAGGEDLRWQVVQMSATPGELLDGAEPFQLQPEDRDPEQSEELACRLAAKKQAQIVDVKAPGPVADVLADAVRRELRSMSGTVGVVVNRVASARRIAAALDDRERILLTGRMRPLDRDLLFARYRHRIEAARARTGDEKPLVVVATQTIEAGADLDFDALVTELAPIDSLKQRFGRLDRRGKLHEAGNSAQAVVLAPKATVSAREPDPVYGEALSAAHRWLRDRHGDDGFDVGPESGDLADPPQETLTPRRRAPLLLPGHLDQLAQTWPRPHHDPLVEPWLHGFDRSEGDVTIVWRADLTEEALKTQYEAEREAGSGQQRVVEQLDAGALAATQRVAVCPPSTAEGMQVPRSAALAWLRRAREVDVADVEGAAPAEIGASRGQLRLALRWQGPEDSRVVRPTASDGDPSATVRSGDTLVVPATYGGISMDNWDPTAGGPVVDVGDRAQLVHRGTVVLRLHKDVLRAHGVDALPAVNADTEDDEWEARVGGWLEAVRDGQPPPRPTDEDSESEEAAETTMQDTTRPTPQPWLRVAAWALLAAGASHPTTFDRGVRRAWVGEETGEPPYLVLGVRLDSGWRQRAAAALPDDVVAEALIGAPLVFDVGDDLDGGDVANSFLGTPEPVRLHDHLEGVGELAGAFARSCGLPKEMREDVQLAGRLHDLGKADPRFQHWLHGSEIAALMADALLAKSSQDSSRDAVASERSRRAAGYPRGARHELLSIALAESVEDVRRQAHDWDLVLHLVASHHGRCRPLAPVVVDPDPRDVSVTWDGHELKANTDHGLERLGNGVERRFLQLTETYGWWGLARLEAILRLADHRRSELERRGAAR